MKGTEARKLVLTGKDNTIFSQCEGLMDPVELRRERRCYHGSLGPHPADDMTSMGISQSEVTAIVNTQAHATSKDRASSDDDKPVELTPQFDTTWVIIDRGNNQFIMSPFLSDQINKTIRAPVALGSGVFRDMTAEEFNNLAKENGGMLAAIKGFQTGKDEDIKHHRVLAEGWLQHLLAKNKPDGVEGPKFEFWKRVKTAYGVKVDCKVAGEADPGDDEEEWEDDDDY